MSSAKWRPSCLGLNVLTPVCFFEIEPYHSQSGLTTGNRYLARKHKTWDVCCEVEGQNTPILSLLWLNNLRVKLKRDISRADYL